MKIVEGFEQVVLVGFVYCVFQRRVYQIVVVCLLQFRRPFSLGGKSVSIVDYILHAGTCRFCLGSPSFLCHSFIVVV